LLEYHRDQQEQQSLLAQPGNPPAMPALRANVMAGWRRDRKELHQFGASEFSGAYSGQASCALLLSLTIGPAYRDWLSARLLPAGRWPCAQAFAKWTDFSGKAEQGGTKRIRPGWRCA